DARIEDEPERRIAWSLLDVPLTWSLGQGRGSRTLARAPARRRILQRRPFDKSPLDLRKALAAPPPRVHALGRREGEAWISAARAAVTSRLREMHTFVHASADDVSSADLGVAELGVIGVRPEARLPLRTFYGYLLARNGVPIGYGDFVLLFEWG